MLIVQPKNASAGIRVHSPDPSEIAHTCPSPHESHIPDASSHATVVAVQKRECTPAADGIPLCRTLPTEQQWPVASSFSQRRSVTSLPDVAANKPESPITSDGDDISSNRLSNFGNRCFLEHKDRINTWIDRLSCPGEMEDAAAAQRITTELYKDRLHWSKHTALKWLDRLDKVERRFRIAGLQYHSTSYALRHSATLLYGRKIDQVVFNRLYDILETDRPRTQQIFFAPWYEIRNVAVDILKDMNYYEPISDDLDFLRTVHRKFELSLLKAPKSFRTLVNGLQWIEGLVAEVADRSELDGSEALASKYSREGSLFRRWMLKLPEVDYEFV